MVVKHLVQAAFHAKMFIRNPCLSTSIHLFRKYTCFITILSLFKFSISKFSLDIYKNWYIPFPVPLWPGTAFAILRVTKCTEAVKVNHTMLEWSVECQNPEGELYFNTGPVDGRNFSFGSMPDLLLHKIVCARDWREYPFWSLQKMHNRLSWIWREGGARGLYKAGTAGSAGVVIFVPKIWKRPPHSLLQFYLFRCAHVSGRF